MGVMLGRRKEECRFVVFVGHVAPSVGAFRHAPPSSPYPRKRRKSLYTHVTITALTACPRAHFADCKSRVIGRRRRVVTHYPLESFVARCGQRRTAAVRTGTRDVYVFVRTL